MKFQLAALLTTLVVSCVPQLSVVSALKCTQAQLQSGPEDEAYMKACPAMASGSTQSSLSSIGSFDMEAMMKASPCKDATCSAYIKNIISEAPDCEYVGLNIKAVMEKFYDVCVRMADGTLTEAEAVEFAMDIRKNFTSTDISQLLDNVNGVASSGDGFGSAVTSTPSPVPTPSSSASSIAVALAVATIGAAAATLLA